MDRTEALTWHTSSYSGGNNQCVEVAITDDGGRLVRDTKDRDGGTLHVGVGAWTAFLTAARDGATG